MKLFLLFLFTFKVHFLLFIDWIIIKVYLVIIVDYQYRSIFLLRIIRYRFSRRTIQIIVFATSTRQGYVYIPYLIHAPYAFLLYFLFFNSLFTLFCRTINFRTIWALKSRSKLTLRLIRSFRPKIVIFFLYNTEVGLLIVFLFELFFWLLRMHYTSPN